jgi:hypothetical protein
MVYLTLYGDCVAGEPTGEAQMLRPFPSAGEALEEAHALSQSYHFTFGTAVGYRIADDEGKFLQGGRF